MVALRWILEISNGQLQPWYKWHDDPILSANRSKSRQRPYVLQFFSTFLASPNPNEKLNPSCIMLLMIASGRLLLPLSGDEVLDHRSCTDFQDQWLEQITLGRNKCSKFLLHQWLCSLWWLLMVVFGLGWQCPVKHDIWLYSAFLDIIVRSIIQSCRFFNPKLRSARVFDSSINWDCEKSGPINVFFDQCIRNFFMSVYSEYITDRLRILIFA